MERQHSLRFTLIDASLVVAIIGIVFVTNASMWRAVFWLCVTLIFGVWCFAIWLAREGVIVWTAQAFPAPESSRFFEQAYSLSGRSARQHAAIAISLGATLAGTLPIVITWLVSQELRIA